MKFVVLSSSRGTTFQAVLERIADGSLKAQCLGLVTDKEDRGCVEKAHAANVRVKIVERRKGEEREAYDKRLHDAIQELQASSDEPTSNVLIATLGWMWILSPWFIAQWKGKIINVHPSLLPKYPGAHAIEDAMKDNASESGMTIHVIDEGVDTGPILLQKTCAITKSDTLDSLKEKIQSLEKEWYPKVLAMIEEGKINL